MRYSPRDARWERRFWLALTAAGVLHAAIVLVSSLRRPRELPYHAQRPYLEVSLLDDTPKAPAADAVQPAAAEEPAARLSTPPQTAVKSLREPSRAEPSVTQDSASAETLPEPEAAGSATASSAPPRPGLSLGALGVGSNPFLGMKDIGAGEAAAAPPAASSEAPDRTRVAEQRLRQYLVGGMLAHDRATGASRNGAVVTALKDAAMLIASPVNGQAEFVAVIDATGLVTALRPTRVSSNAEDWRNVAARALKALAKKRLHVPAGAAGLEVRLALSSKIQLPSGSSSVATLHQVPLVSEDGTRLSRLELPKESEKLPDANDPGALGTPMLRQPIPGGGLDGDLADIGGVGRRIVHVTITDERPL
ncbi:MAG TPA: hypothetical protein VHC69_27245 [Polyangiaceae bacterium]|nr:hypothetical protein [Polyangiaceae bacterium]